MATNETLTLTKGSNWAISVDCNKANMLTPLDLSGSASVNLYIKNASLNVVGSFAATITDPVNALATFNITPANQSAVASGDYTFAIRATDASGIIYDQSSGTLTVLSDPSLTG